MPTSRFRDRFVVFPSGAIVPVDCYRLVLDLLGRGLTFGRQDHTTLVVRPADRLTPEDRAQIARWKWHILMLLDHDHVSDLQPYDIHDMNDRTPGSGGRHGDVR